MASTRGEGGQGGMSFIISTNTKLSQSQVHTLAEAGMRQGMPFKISAEGALQATDENARRRKVKTLRNHGTVDSDSVTLESVMVPGQGVRYALKFKYSASEDMNAKVFFHAKDVGGKLAIRSRLDGVKKWDDIVLPSGKDLSWDSSTAERDGLFLSDEDPVFLRLRSGKGDGDGKKHPHLYDVVIVLSFLNNNSLYSSDERRSSAQPLTAPAVESPQYSVNPMKGGSSPSSKCTEGLDTGEIELRSGRIGDMRKNINARWAEAKGAMLQGFGSLRNDPSSPGIGDTDAPGGGGNSEFVTCEKTRCRLLSLPDKDWIPPPAPRGTTSIADRDRKGEDEGVGVNIRVPGDRFGSLRHKYSAGSGTTTTASTRSGSKATDAISSSQEGNGENGLVRGPSIRVECLSQALLYNDEEFLSKEVFGGTWEDLCPAAATESMKEEDKGDDDEGGTLVAFEEDAEAKNDIRAPETTELSEAVIDFRDSEDKPAASAPPAPVIAAKGKSDSLFDDDDADYQDSYCVICMSAPRQVIVHPCNHCCVCSGCATVLSANTEGFSNSVGRNNQIKCPMCRVQVSAMIYLRDRKRPLSSAQVYKDL